MNRTPQLRSSWPLTPEKFQRNLDVRDDAKSKSLLPRLPESSPILSIKQTPVIPVSLIDAPSQRMYTVAAYGLLLVWCIYDWWRLVEEDATSLWLFLKWTCIHASFLYGVPWLRIPWLEWSETTSHFALMAHAGLNGMLMFRVPLPIEGWLMLLIKTFFDKELSVSENSVRPARILHNSSLIMGKQIIHILPEGSVVMNPDGLPFCLNSSHSSVKIPIRYNQTVPSHVEILRLDFEANSNETIVLSSKERKGIFEDNEHTTALAYYTVKKPGVYRLHKVIDESNLEVRRKMSDTLIVRCPTVQVAATGSEKCLGDLSDLNMEIEGTPPLKIVYTRVANADQSTHHLQSIQPENFVSPLLGSTRSSTLVAAVSQDYSWARSHRIKVPLNESMTPSGKWKYSIDEIHDATGNVANFSARGEDGEYIYPKDQHLEQSFEVHERPLVTLAGCDSRNPLMIANGKTGELPVDFKTYGRAPDRSSHTLTWKFSPLDTLTASGDHGSAAITEQFFAKTARDKPVIGQAGLYTLTGVKSQFCEGEVKEPASCLLLNPPEPQLSISAENINDKCAGSSIGLLVDLDLIGTPPFVVRYEIVTQDGTRAEKVNVISLRHQLELKPREAGHFKYRFTSVDDAVYKGQQLKSKVPVLEQDVKPPASAWLVSPSDHIDACIEEPVEINVQMTGESPFALEYELIHDGKRSRQKVEAIESHIFKIRTDSLRSGGEYSLALASVKDKTGCKIFLNDEIKFSVRRQRPKASFGQLDGKHKVTEIAGREISLPLRLTGRGPWSVKYSNLNDTSGKIIEKQMRSSNDFIKVDHDGLYKILEVSDDQCPGTVDPLASTFAVEWLPRPQIKFVDTAVVEPEGKKFVKREVCEGDVDAIEVNLIGEWARFLDVPRAKFWAGSSPYHVTYQVLHKPERGSGSISNKEFDAALGVATIPMDTTKPGSYQYKFLELSDGLYEHDAKKFTPLVMEQKVNRKPSAHFVKPGQSYKYCKEELSGDEIIPIKLEGTPPFHLEIDIKHQSSSRPETVKIPNIDSNHYDFRIPHRVLSLGVHQVSVRKVRDSHGCQQKTEFGAPHVQVQVYDVPTIYPLESRADYCVGERISYTLSGTAPFEIFYTFEGVLRKAKSSSTNFRRIAEKPGTFTIIAIADKASECKASTELTKIIHEMPSIKISKGRQVEVDIHEGGEAEILFEFWGTPPFEFTYTRSTNAKKGQKSQVLETRHDVSYQHSKTIQSSQEGTYEVIAIKDKYCSFSTQKEDRKIGKRLLQL